MARLCSVSRWRAGLAIGLTDTPAVDPAGVVPLEQVVGQRRQDEVVGPQHVPLRLCGVRRVQVRLEHAADQELGQRRAVEVVEQLAQRRR